MIYRLLYTSAIIIIILTNCKDGGSKVKVIPTDKESVIKTDKLKDPPLNINASLLVKDTVLSKGDSNIIVSTENTTALTNDSASLTDDLRSNEKSQPIDERATSSKSDKSKRQVQKPKAEKVKEVKSAINSKLILDSILFDSLVMHYDTIVEGDKLKRKFYFTNKNDLPIEVVSTYPDCGCTAPSFPFLPIEKDEKGFIGVNYNSVGKSGPQESAIHIKFKGIKEEKIILLKGFVKDKPKDKKE